MNERVGSPRIGQWYRRGGKGGPFLVTGRDPHAGTIEIQSLDGDLDEIDEANWSALPLEFAEAPEDSSGPLDSQPDQTGDEGTPEAPAEFLETLENEPDPLAEAEAEAEAEPREATPTDRPPGKPRRRAAR